MATLSSILAWKIPWTEEPGGLYPWGHKESDTTGCTHTHTHTWMTKIQNNPRLSRKKPRGSVTDFRAGELIGLN